MSDRPDVCKCGHPLRVHVDGRCDGTYRGTTHGPGLCECKAFQAQQTQAPDGPPAAALECRRCLDDHRVWSTNDETGRWLLCPECSGLPLADDGVAPLAPWRPRLVAVGDREVRLHTDDGAYRYLVHVTPGHAEPFVAAVNAAMVRGPTPDGPPVAADKAGERWDDHEAARKHADTETGKSLGFPDTSQGIAYRAFLAGLAHGRDRLRAMEAALRRMLEESTNPPWKVKTVTVEAARAALGAGPGT